MPIIPVAPNVQSDYPVGVEQGARYVLIGPDGTRAVFNDRSDIDFVGFLTAPPSGLDGPDVRESADLIVEGSGGIHGNFYFGRRPWTLEGLIDPTPDPTRDYTEGLTLTGTNLLTNPTFEVDLATWSPSYSLSLTGTGMTRPGGYGCRPGYPDSFVMRQQATQPNDTTLRWAIAQCGQLVPVTPGVAYSFSAYLYCGSPWTTQGPTARIQWLNGAGAGVGVLVDGSPHTGGAGTFSRISTMGVAPAGAVSAIVQIYAGTSVANQSLDFAVDYLQFAQGSTIPDYFDGTTYPGGYPLRTAWDSTAHASRSYLWSVARTNMNAAATTNRRINRLQRASRAMVADAALNWTPALGKPVMLNGRRQAFRIGADRLPKTFQLGMVSSERRILGQTVKTISGAGGSNLTLRNDGNTNGTPIITLRDAWTNPIITNQGTGEQIRLTTTLVGGDVVVVDVAAKTITKNGANIYSALQFPASSWFEVQPGDVVVVPSGSGGGTWQIDYRDAWE